MVGKINIAKLLQEPGIDLGELVDAVNRITGFKRCRNGKNSGIGRMRKRVVYIVKFVRTAAHKSESSLAHHSQTLLDSLLKALTDRHNLSDTLHTGVDLA